MRHHPRNSPAAAARLVALALIADGHVCRSELAALRQAGAETALGLAPGELGEVLQGLCEDLLLAQHTGKPWSKVAQYTAARQVLEAAGLPDAEARQRERGAAMLKGGRASILVP